MSLLLKIYNTERLLIKNGILSIGRYYSRRSKSNNPYEIVIRNNVEDKTNDECGPNWELLNPVFNRFHLPGKLGPAWQCNSSIYDGNVKLKELVDFNSKVFKPKHQPFLQDPYSCAQYILSEKSRNCLIPIFGIFNDVYDVVPPLEAGPYPGRLRGATLQLTLFTEYLTLVRNSETKNDRKCPMLLLNDLDELFFLNGTTKETSFTVITLHYPKHTEVEHSAKNFVIAARAICMCLQAEYHWADFINPFNGLPFFESKQEKIFTNDEGFRGLANDEGFRYLGSKFESRNNCLVIKSNTNGTFGGNIFTSYRNDIDKMQRIFFATDYDSDE